MRLRNFLALGLVSLTACGGGGGGGGNPDAAPPKDGPTPTDGPTPDAPAATCTPVSGTNVRVEELTDASVDDLPVLVTAPRGDHRLFVVQKNGIIKIIKDGHVVAQSFLDIRSKIVDSGGNEQGLLGLAFHPDYASNGRFFVYYTGGKAPQSNDPYTDVVAEYKVSAADPDRADATGKVLLAIPDFEWNHNGGMIEFGPDKKLWIGTGDGGSGGDPEGNGQKKSSLLAKMLRIDVDTRTGQKPYGIPANNPYANSPDGPNDPRPEIWAIGLRNPWRYSFDAKTGDLYIGDVGQERYEEVDIVSSTQADLNFGWSDWEGNRTYPGNANENDPAITYPVVVHTQSGGGEGQGWCSVIGGPVYRSTCFPDLDGWYFYGDYCKEELWTFRWENGQIVDGSRKLLLSGSGNGGTFVPSPTSIHTDGFGEMYVTSETGRIYRIVAGP